MLDELWEGQLCVIKLIYENVIWKILANVFFLPYNIGLRIFCLLSLITASCRMWD